MQRYPTAWGYRRLGELWLHHYRLDAFENITAAADRQNPEVDEAALQTIWRTTSLTQLHGWIYQAQRTGRLQYASTLRNDPIVQRNLRHALHAFQQARARSPLQPTLHLWLGQLHALSETPGADAVHLERCKQLAPTNDVNWFICGILELNAGRVKQAKDSLRRCLELSSKNYEKVVPSLLPVLSKREIVEDVLPAKTTLLLAFVDEHLTKQSDESLRTATLLQVERLLQQVEGWDRKSLREKVDVQSRLGKKLEAIETLQQLTRFFPRSSQDREELAERLLEYGRTQTTREARVEAFQNAFEVIKLLHSRKNSRYQRLYDEIYEAMVNEELDFVD